MCRPARVGDAGQALHMLGLDLLHQLRHPGRRTGPLQTQAQAIGILRLYCHTTGVIATVLQTLEALNQNRNDIAMRNRCHNATHR